MGFFKYNFPLLILAFMITMKKLISPKRFKLLFFLLLLFLLGIAIGRAVGLFLDYFYA